ncbi:hypothetical protein ACERIM_04685 [Natrinema sp. H-ect1]|uniref:hypothetical protein n=1 Tax=Natrinema sp. H-ect1 TaxID=3242700 RepID=UPI00359D2E48
MRMNRRNVLVGLGTIVAGGGAALGTGAFSSVSADRTVNVTTAGDSSALLAIQVDSSYAGSGDQAQINLNSPGNSDGLNSNATTTFNAVIALTNQGTDEVTISPPNPDLSSTSGLDSMSFSVNSGYDVNGNGNFESGAADTTSSSTNETLSQGETVVYDMTITTGSTIGSFSPSVTFKANST